jgi:starch-binding outer membrane protein, SusD/RagB family
MKIIMSKLNKTLIYGILALLSVSSCKKELTLTPVSSISASAFWNTENDATGALYGMYVRFRNVTATNLFIWGESRAQDITASIGVDATNSRNFDNTLDATAAGPDWSTLYSVVNDANGILKNVPNIKFAAPDNQNRILAEAHTMRAYCYFVLVRTWGAVPLVTDPAAGYNPAVIYKERSSPADVFTLIKQDIDSALSLYPDNNFITGRNRWTKPGANALKGDVYLWTGKVLGGGASDFTIALGALNDVGTSDVSLLSDFSSIFDYSNKGNQEIIMASNYTEYETTGTFMANLYMYSGLPPNVSPAGKDSLGVLGGDNYWTLTQDTRSRFSYDDLRRKASFIDLYTADPVTGLYTVFFLSVQRKFDGMIDNGIRNFLDDVILYRYADVLLMKSEAENALGQDPSDGINAVRMRAYGANFGSHTFVSTTQDENDSLILNERLLELVYEGKRWWDILRFNKADELIPFFKNNPGSEYKFLWPLSLNILSLEPKAVQNPGY